MAYYCCYFEAAMKHYTPQDLHNYPNIIKVQLYRKRYAVRTVASFILRQTILHIFNPRDLASLMTFVGVGGTICTICFMAAR